MGTREKQKEIRSLLRAMSWSFSDLAEAVIEFDNDDFVEDEAKKIAALSEAIKKQLSRRSTSDEKLDKYLRVIEDHETYKALKLGFLRPQFVDHSILDDALTEAIKDLSMELDNGQ